MEQPPRKIVLGEQKAVGVAQLQRQPRPLLSRAAGRSVVGPQALEEAEARQVQPRLRAVTGPPRRRNRPRERLGMLVAPGVKEYLPVAPAAARVRLQMIVIGAATERYKPLGGGQTPLAINPGERCRLVINATASSSIRPCSRA